MAVFLFEKTPDKNNKYSLIFFAVAAQEEVRDFCSCRSEFIALIYI